MLLAVEVEKKCPQMGHMLEIVVLVDPVAVVKVDSTEFKGKKVLLLDPVEVEVVRTQEMLVWLVEWGRQVL
jgi:hypothetical protein